MSSQHDQIRSAVREQYSKIAEASPRGGCAPACCGGSELEPVDSELLGYSAEELAALPEGANLGLGCGNPVAIAALREGERVLDLGSGGGIDCLLAAKRVGPEGQVIGVDMTPAMVEKARKNVRQAAGADNVSIRLGEIEHLPVADASVDVILSNCVINLSPDKESVFRETFRVLAPGGRLSISDVVATAPLPDELRDEAEALTGCVSGAVPAEDLQKLLREIGFEKVTVEVSEASRAFIKDWFPGSGAERYVASATISAVKPGGACCAPSCCDGDAGEVAE
ncbi:MAG TPA: arsenite methyltransferase [Polyangiaceae bacterium]|nr:arsenite methyltransferase [Polyangiaceae bacterium]